MAREEQAFKYESLQDRDSVVQYLRDILTGFEKGHLELGNKRDHFVIEPEGLIKLDVKATKKNNRTKLSFQLSWSDEDIAQEEKL